MYILISIHTITPHYINMRIFITVHEIYFTLLPIFTPSEIGLNSTLRSGLYYISVPE